MKSVLLGAVCVCLWLFLGLSVGEAQAGLITWNFQALLTDLTATDPLDIDGETLNMEITYDDTDVWASSGGFLYYPSASATATITGSHTVTLNTPNPAALHGDATSLAAVTEQTFTASFVDFVIDGITTITTGFQGTSPTTPSVGDNLLPTHLLTPSTVTAASIRGCPTIGGACYSLTAAPIPPAVWLFGSGLIGLFVMARRRTV